MVYGPDVLWAIEVKRRARLERRDLAGLQAFGADYPEAQRWLLSLAPETLTIDGIRCEPVEGWLRRLTPEGREGKGIGKTSNYSEYQKDLSLKEIANTPTHPHAKFAQPQRIPPNTTR